MLKNEIIREVCTGEVQTARHRTTLLSNAIGSCIAVVIIDLEKRIGGIAHVMLPGQADPSRKGDSFRYAEDAIRELLRQLHELGSSESELIAVLAGGGNVLQRADDTICAMNIASVQEILKRRSIPVGASSLGGTDRRTVRLDLACCNVFQALGNNNEELLWSGSQNTHKGI